MAELTCSRTAGIGRPVTLILSARSVVSPRTKHPSKAGPVRRLDCSAAHEHAAGSPFPDVAAENDAGPGKALLVNVIGLLLRILHIFGTAPTASNLPCW